MYASDLEKEMNAVFERRTKLHIALVRNNLLKMERYLGLDIALLKERANEHDASKFNVPERISYLWMTWTYYCKQHGKPFDCTESIKNIIYEGWQHHIHHNRHHPEAHADLNAMTVLDIVEMVCDWTAISQEMGMNNGSCLRWAYEHVDKKWSFSNEKKVLIFSTIEALDERNQQLGTQYPIKEIT